MFPLGSVLLPGAVLPLHVFEPRYRALVQHCLDTEEHEFGVTLISRGSEVGGGDQRLDIGTVARMVQVAELEGGRYAVVCVGTRRIRINAWLPDDPYPLADIDDWPDDEPTGAAADELHERITTTLARVRRSCALAAELGDSVADASVEIADDPVLASYHLVALAPVGPADTYTLLCADGPLARVDRLDAMLDDVEAVLQFRLADESSDLDLDD
jgi:Lon protease-like protein